jgi:hypothetical protein
MLRVYPAGIVLLLITVASGQYVSDSDDILDDLSFLDVAEDGGENARLCVRLITFTPSTSR